MRKITKKDNVSMYIGWWRIWSDASGTRLVQLDRIDVSSVRFIKTDYMGETVVLGWEFPGRTPLTYTFWKDRTALVKDAYQNAVFVRKQKEREIADMREEVDALQWQADQLGSMLFNLG